MATPSNVRFNNLGVYFDNVFLFGYSFFSDIIFIDINSTNIVKGKLIKCACKSANKKVKYGNSVIPYVSEGIILLLAQ